MSHANRIALGLAMAAAIDANEFTLTERGGIAFPKLGMQAHGQFETWVNGRDHQIDPNIVPAEGLIQILKSGLKGQAFYIAPFVNNLSPAANLTAASFTGTLGEFQAYDEATRPQWVIPADPVAGAFDNSASPAVFTAAASVGTGAGVDVYGAAILSASGKGATTGVIVCASRFSAARNLKATDKLTVQYTISATSTG